MGHPVILSAWLHQKPQKRGIPILPVGHTLAHRPRFRMNLMNPKATHDIATSPQGYRKGQAGPDGLQLQGVVSARCDH